MILLPTYLRRFDTYFFNDLPRLSEHFTTLNPSSLGTLIKLFFIYYAGEQSPTSFNYSTDVISLRRKGVKKEEKGWMDDHERDHNHICIEVSLHLSMRVEGFLLMISLDPFRILSRQTTMSEGLFKVPDLNLYVYTICLQTGALQRTLTLRDFFSCPFRRSGMKSGEQRILS